VKNKKVIGERVEVECPDRKNKETSMLLARIYIQLDYKQGINSYSLLIFCK
jgi:hypothetical protein